MLLLCLLLRPRLHLHEEEVLLGWEGKEQHTTALHTKMSTCVCIASLRRHRPPEQVRRGKCEISADPSLVVETAFFRARAQRSSIHGVRIDDLDWVYGSTRSIGIGRNCAI